MFCTKYRTDRPVNATKLPICMNNHTKEGVSAMIGAILYELSYKELLKYHRGSPLYEKTYKSLRKLREPLSISVRFLLDWHKKSGIRIYDGSALIDYKL